MGLMNNEYLLILQISSQFLLRDGAAGSQVRH